MQRGLPEGIGILIYKDVLVLLGRTYVTNASGHPKKFKRRDLNTAAKVLMTLVLYSIR